MTTRTKKLATVATAAVVLTSGAYALGTQAGDGGALASGSRVAAAGSPAAANTAVGAVAVSNSNGTTTRTFGRHGGQGGRGFGFGLDNIAQRLGVSTTALQNALKAIRDEKTPAQRRTDFINALAAALGKPADQVTSAVNSVLPDRGAGRPGDRRGDFAAALAKALGVDEAKVQAGLDSLRQQFRNGNRDRDHSGRRGGRRAFGDDLVNAIAKSTGVDAAKVRSALQSLKPDRGDRHGGRDDLRQKLATALGVTTDQLQTALDKVATDTRNAFATELAQKLNIDVQKVQDVLKDFPGPGRRHP
jgi:ClpA/ClpB-like protein